MDATTAAEAPAEPDSSDDPGTGDQDSSDDQETRDQDTSDDSDRSADLGDSDDQ